MPWPPTASIPTFTDVAISTADEQRVSEAPIPLPIARRTIEASKLPVPERKSDRFGPPLVQGRPTRSLSHRMDFEKAWHSRQFRLRAQRESNPQPSA
jgi:hypothetical protein